MFVAELKLVRRVRDDRQTVKNAAGVEHQTFIADPLIDCPRDIWRNIQMVRIRIYIVHQFDQMTAAASRDDTFVHGAGPQFIVIRMLWDAFSPPWLTSFGGAMFDDVIFATRQIPQPADPLRGDRVLHRMEVDRQRVRAVVFDEAADRLFRTCVIRFQN